MSTLTIFNCLLYFANVDVVFRSVNIFKLKLMRIILLILKIDKFVLLITCLGGRFGKNCPSAISKFSKITRVIYLFSIYIYNIKIYKHEIQEKLIKKHIKIQELNIYYNSNAYNEAAQYN